MSDASFFCLQARCGTAAERGKKRGASGDVMYGVAYLIVRARLGALEGARGRPVPAAELACMLACMFRRMSAML